MQLTKKDLDGLINERIEGVFGASAEEVKGHLARLKELDEASREKDRTVSSALVYGLEKGAAHVHPYYEKAGHVIRNDQSFKGLGFRLARAVRAYGASALSAKNGPKTDPKDIALKWGDKWLAEDIERGQSPENVKALTGLDPTSNIGTGGALVPVEYMQEIIELLRSRNVVRASGARVFPLETGAMNIPRHTGAATAAYVGENTNHTTSDQSFDQVTLRAKKLIASTAVSNDLMRSSDPNADQVVRDDIVATLANRQDLAFLRGDGTSDDPVGILNAIAGANSQSANATVNIANVVADATAAMELVEGADTPMLRPVWYMTSRTKNGLLRLVTSEGNFLFRDELSAGTFMGYPYFITNQIPKNLGAGTNETEVYFGDATEALIGDTRVFDLEVFPGGAYYDGSNVISGIAQDQTVIKVVSTHDFDLRHDTSFSVTDSVLWGD
jgi:HK97 family phage major capsid protein